MALEICKDTEEVEVLKSEFPVIAPQDHVSG
jgi:hypothetical protein